MRNKKFWLSGLSFRQRKSVSASRVVWKMWSASRGKCDVIRDRTDVAYGCRTACRNWERSVLHTSDTGWRRHCHSSKSCSWTYTLHVTEQPHMQFTYFFSSTDSSLHETKNKIFLSVLRVNVPYQRHIVIVIISSISSWLASDFCAVLSTWSLSSMIPFTAFYFSKSLFVTSRLSSKTKLSKCTQSRHVFGLLLLLYTICIIHSFWTSLKPHFCRWTLLSMWRRYKSLFWHSMWFECGKPKTGVVADVMRKTRASYHYAIRHVRKCEQQIVK